jgi:hypothetical protein
VFPNIVSHVDFHPQEQPSPCDAASYGSTGISSYILTLGLLMNVTQTQRLQNDKWDPKTVKNAHSYAGILKEMTISYTTAYPCILLVAGNPGRFPVRTAVSRTIFEPGAS